MTLLQLTHKQYNQLQQIQQKEKLNIYETTKFHFTSLHSTSRTSLYLTHFTFFNFLMISAPLSLNLVYHFPNPFSKTAWFAGESP
jgi:hypothetical protein